MRTVWKYEVQMPSKGDFRLTMPVESTFAYASHTRQGPVCWFEVNTNPDMAMITRVLRTFLTGDKITDDYERLATVVTDGGQFVWHLYERL